MTEPVKGDEPNVDNARLERAQQIRHDVINAYLYDEEGNLKKNLSTEELNAMRGLAKDSDSSIFTKRRVMTEEKTAETDRMAAEILSRMEFTPPKRHDDQPVEGQRTERAAPTPDPTLLPDAEESEYITSGLSEDVVDINSIIAEGRRLTKGIEEE